jgi:hypothetical protein
MRSEALKPAAPYPGMPPGPSSMPPDMRGPPSYADMRGGYPDMSAGAYGGMGPGGYGGYPDYSGYGTMSSMSP